jgi:acyl dehydratase
MKINDLYIGLSCSLSKSFSLKDVEEFAKLSMDNNPVHLDPEYASNSLFGKRIVHGYLTSSLFSAIIGTKMPGNGSIYIKQDLTFKKPVFHDEMITATVTIRDIKLEKSIIFLNTICTKDNGEIAIEGNAIVKLIE